MRNSEKSKKEDPPPLSPPEPLSALQIAEKADLDEEDGGWRGWMTLAGTFVAMFAQFGLANSYGAFQAYYETHQLAAYGSDTVGWIGGVQQFFLLFGVSYSSLFRLLSSDRRVSFPVDCWTRTAYMRCSFRHQCSSQPASCSLRVCPTRSLCLSPPRPHLLSPSLSSPVSNRK